MNIENIALFLLRISIGWLFFYAGITKILDNTWTAEGYIKGAKTLPTLYNYLLQPGVLPVVNLMVEWGLLLIGISLILGIFLSISAPLGMLMMVLLYLPILQFPYPNAHSYIVDEHVIYFFALFVLWALNAGRVFGLGGRFG